MNMLLLAAFALSAPQMPAPDDLRCYRLMSDLALAEDPAVRALGLGGAQFFIGRIDAAAPGYDFAATPAVPLGERPAMLRRCTEMLGASGFDLRGGALEAPAPTV
jgi:hypothetical protein